MLLTKENNKTTDKKLEKGVIKLEENKVVQNFKNYFELSNRWFKIKSIIRLEDDSSFPEDVQIYYSDKTGEKFLRRNDNNKDFISSFELAIDRDFNLIYKEYNFFVEIKKKNVEKAYRTFEDMDEFLSKMNLDKRECVFNTFSDDLEFQKYFKSKFSKSPLFSPKIFQGELIFSIASEAKILDDKEDVLIFVNHKQIKNNLTIPEICVYQRQIQLPIEKLEQVNNFISISEFAKMNSGYQTWFDLRPGTINKKYIELIKDNAAFFSSRSLELETLDYIIKHQPEYVFFIDEEDAGILYFVPFLYVFHAYKEMKNTNKKCLLIPVMEEENEFE